MILKRKRSAPTAAYRCFADAYPARSPRSKLKYSTIAQLWKDELPVEECVVVSSVVSDGTPAEGNPKAPADEGRASSHNGPSASRPTRSLRISGASVVTETETGVDIYPADGGSVGMRYSMYQVGMSYATSGDAPIADGAFVGAAGGDSSEMRGKDSTRIAAEDVAADDGAETGVVAVRPPPTEDRALNRKSLSMSEVPRDEDGRRVLYNVYGVVSDFKLPVFHASLGLYRCEMTLCDMSQYASYVRHLRVVQFTSDLRNALAVRARGDVVRLHRVHASKLTVYFVRDGEDVPHSSQDFLQALVLPYSSALFFGGAPADSLWPIHALSNGRMDDGSCHIFARATRQHVRTLRKWFLANSAYTAMDRVGSALIKPKPQRLIDLFVEIVEVQRASRESEPGLVLFRLYDELKRPGLDGLMLPSHARELISSLGRTPTLPCAAIVRNALLVEEANSFHLPRTRSGAQRQPSRVFQAVRLAKEKNTSEEQVSGATTTIVWIQTLTQLSEVALNSQHNLRHPKQRLAADDEQNNEVTVAETATSP